MNRYGAIGIVQVLICALVVVTGSSSVISFGVIVPSYVRAFGSDVGVISLAVSILLLVVGLASPIIGRLLDRYSVRSVLAVGGISLATGFVGASFSSDVTQLLACYGILGLGTSMLAPLVVVKHMTVWFPDRIGLATALVTAPFGAVLFPPLTQWLITEFEWRQSLQLFALSILVIMFTLLLLRSSPQSSLAQASLADSAVSSNTADANAEKLSSLQVYKPLLCSFMFWFSILAFCTFAAAQMSLLTHFPVMAESKGLLASDGVQLLVVMGAASLIGAPLSGLISDYFGPRSGYILLATCQIAALGLLLGEASHLELTITAVILGLFMSAAYVFCTGYLTKVIGVDNFGTGFGLATLITAVVVAVPPTIAGNVFDATGSYDSYFAVLAGLTLLAGVGSWLLGNPGQVEYLHAAHQGG